MTDTIKLNVGSGPNPMPGYINLDIKDGNDACALQYEKNSAGEIRASHVLEHISHTKTIDVLRHWFDVLKPGGVVKIAVPNLEYIVERLSQQCEEPLEGYLMGGQSDDDDYHKAAFTYTKLEQMLRIAGFECVSPWESDFADCSAMPVSLNLQAVKPSGPTKLNDVCLLLSVPRLMWTDNVIPMMAMVRDLGLNVIANTGAFWGQCLERIMEDALRDLPNVTHVLTCDYDSIFSTDQVKQLYRTALKTDADAIFPVQVKRQAAHAMLSVRDADGTIRRSLTNEEVRREALKVCTGHFGLTLLKTSAIKKLPKPWFREVPAPDGTWGDGHIDPDIWFWQQWEAAGNSLYQANHVRIGHAQLMATFPDRRWLPQHVHMSEVQSGGIPVFAR